MNPTHQHIGIHKEHLVSITETDIPHKAIDASNNTWTFNKSWKMDYIPIGKLGDSITQHGVSRDSVWFDTYRQIQESIAEETLEEMMTNRRKIVNESFIILNVWYPS